MADNAELKIVFGAMTFGEPSTFSYSPRSQQVARRGPFYPPWMSNNMAWEVAQVCEICKSHGCIIPSVYQGVYHILKRSIEGESIPWLREYDIALYAFHTKGIDRAEEGSRFDPKILQGSVHRKRHWNAIYVNALEGIEAAASKYGLTLPKGVAPNYWH
ncbi:uncharacterized protein N7459_000370 [Penicillium hispanicum]|uniref:uncharacterized protein n=1 Tax=Penicillium hispanicum TaxID=1080232 RepID=UPI00253F69E5|nr:uncharacterized protein N7459_000370 [Penicillium hispanicum]KAJ5594162.1 hypothetical protein N7459_000370 [Penicillium hispanicum]